jgi:hypothetical protein
MGTKAGGRDPGTQKLACPYFKHDPAKYRQWRVCCGPGWGSIHRVKYDVDDLFSSSKPGEWLTLHFVSPREHLYRRHRQQKFRCNRCGATFANEDLLEDHQRLTRPCPLRDKAAAEGFGESQERLLRVRSPKSAGDTEVHRWRQIYKIIFPNVDVKDIPSPCKRL